MRTVQAEDIKNAVKEMCISVNYQLSDDMKFCMDQAVQKENSVLGKKILCQLEENLKIAREDRIPI